MHDILVVIAVVLFAIDALTYFVAMETGRRHPGGRLSAAGLAFFAASFISIVK